MRRPTRWPPKAALSVAGVATIGLVLLFMFGPLAERPAIAEESVQSASAALDPALSLPAWMDFELNDAITEDAFTIRELIGKPILLESFAVWCSICLRQQKEMALLVEREGERIVHISLDTDPNEDLAEVREHALAHGFDWRYAVAPIKMTQQLIEAFGLTVVNAPRAPVVLIEPDGSSRLLPSGVKSADRLLEEIGLEPTPEDGE